MEYIIYTEQSVTQQGVRGFVLWQYILSKCGEEEKKIIQDFYYRKFYKLIYKMYILIIDIPGELAEVLLFEFRNDAIQYVIENREDIYKKDFPDEREFNIKDELKEKGCCDINSDIYFVIRKRRVLYSK